MTCVCVTGMILLTQNMKNNSVNGTVLLTQRECQRDGSPDKCVTGTVL